MLRKKCIAALAVILIFSSSALLHLLNPILLMPVKKLERGSKK